MASRAQDRWLVTPDALIARIDGRTAKVVIVARGEVGLPGAMRAVAVGLPTVGLELDERRLAALRAGDSYVEDVPSEELRGALANGYQATNQLGDLVGFDVAVISVPTPLREGVPDLSFVEQAAES